MKKNVILTFDYEVFLGSKTGSIDKCVLTPTREILEILKQNEAKAIFFVDATWLLFLKKNFPSDLLLIKEQLKDIIKTGSTVELHLHPQWIDAFRTEDKIEFRSFDNYRLHSLSQADITNLFRDSIELLEGITSQKIQCFRAGGFSIEPFSYVKSAFQMFKIKYDFSVVPGMLLTGGNVYDYNFVNVPNRSYYTFQDDVKIQDKNGSFVEVPLTTYQHNPVYTLIKLLLSRHTKDNIYGDGTGIYLNHNPYKNLFSKWLRLSKTPLSLDNTNNLFFKYIIKLCSIKSNILVIISHPKTLSRQALLNLSFVARNYNTLNSFDLNKYLTR